MIERSQNGKPILLAFGANLASPWGYPAETFRHAIVSLAASGVIVRSVSKLYRTKAVGPGLQNVYYNAVVTAQSDRTPVEILRIAKQIERAAGRRRGRAWTPRSLDIDIIDYKGRILGSPTLPQAAGGLVLPHPQMHKRAFVLVPLLDVAPRWRHPVVGRSAQALLKALPLRVRQGVGPSSAFLPSLANSTAACDNT